MSGHQSGHEGVVSQRGQEGEIALVENEPGLVPDPDQRAGQIDERAVTPPRPDGHNDHDVRAQQLRGARQQVAPARWYWAEVRAIGQTASGTARRTGQRWGVAGVAMGDPRPEKRQLENKGPEVLFRQTPRSILVRWSWDPSKVIRKWT